eukprot:5221894-Prymnesium_polylepis.2
MAPLEVNAELMAPLETAGTDRTAAAARSIALEAARRRRGRAAIIRIELEYHYAETPPSVRCGPHPRRCERSVR